MGGGNDYDLFIFDECEEILILYIRSASVADIFFYKSGSGDKQKIDGASSLLKFFPLEIMVAGSGGTFQKALASYIYVAMQSEKVQKI